MSDDIKRMSESEPEGPRMPKGLAEMPLKVRRGRMFECDGRTFSSGESIPVGHACRVTHSSYLTHDIADAAAPAAAPSAPAAAKSDPDVEAAVEADTEAPRGFGKRKRKSRDDD